MVQGIRQSGDTRSRLPRLFTLRQPESAVSHRRQPRRRWSDACRSRRGGRHAIRFSLLRDQAGQQARRSAEMAAVASSNDMSKKKIAFLSVSVALLLSLLGGALFGQATQKNNVYRYISIFTEVYELVQHNYVEQVPADQLMRSEEHTSELQSPDHLVCRLLLE